MLKKSPILKRSFEQTIRELCEDVLSEPTPKALPEKIIDHVQRTFPVQWSTLWLTEQTGTEGGKRLRLAAASGPAKKLLKAEKGGPAVYNFGEGLTGEIALSAEARNIQSYDDFKNHPAHAKKYDTVMYGDLSSAKDQCRCVLGVPLLLKSTGEAGSADDHPWRVIGVLKLENKESADHHAVSFTPQDVEIVKAYAAVIAVALEKAQMREDSIRIGAGLLEVSQSLQAELGNAPNLDKIVLQTAKVISAEACSLWLRSGLQLQLKAAYGFDGNKDQVPPYQLEDKADVDDPLIQGADAVDSEEHTCRGVGLTVYVAKTGKSLNLKTAEEVRTHLAWQGANDERMWAKPRGSACYSLVAIPLIDNYTNDLRGVFKIENKKLTLFQLQSFFTKEDEQLLKILGNSISSSLIISERIRRLRSLERLVGNVRVLDDLDAALFFILTGLTHRDGLEYNRAMIFLVDKVNPEHLVCQFAVGQTDPSDWQNEMERAVSDPPLDLDMLLRDFRADKQKFLRNPMMKQWKGCEVNTGNPDRDFIARRVASQELNTSNHQTGDIPRADMLSGFARGDFVLIPITFERELKGIIYADNAFTGNRVNRFECEMLDLFAGMAGAIIHASSIPERLRREQDEAWKTFSRPAAHRLGTDVSIIDTEVDRYIKRELSVATAISDGRLAVNGDVIENSLKVIQQAVNRLRYAVKDYQRLALEVEQPDEFDLCDLVEQTIKKATIGLRGIEALPNYVDRPLWIRGALGGITYVLEELLINAWKEFQPDWKDDEDLDVRAETPDVRVSIDLRREQDKAVCIVSDNGPGIPQDLIPTLFKKLRTGRTGGTGLGLLMSAHILEENGATIELRAEGKPEGFDGACFRITFPLCRPAVKHAPNVLVVEDNAVNRRHLSRILTDIGFICDLVRNETEAMSRVTNSLSLIVADINLSGARGSVRGGILLAEMLKEKGIRIPIILVSADPWYYLPAKGGPEFDAMKRDLGIIDVIDRNESGWPLALTASLQWAGGV